MASLNNTSSSIVINIDPFDFNNTVMSHGWVFLAPFLWKQDSQELCYTFQVRNSVVEVIISYKRDGSNSALIITPKDRRRNIHRYDVIKDSVARMFRLNDDFSEFYTICNNHPLLSWVSKQKCGRLLRSATVFEDVIKTVCTTNTDWRNTKKMCQGLCELTNGAFPSAKQILYLSENEILSHSPLGYRIRTIVELAERFAYGELPLDEWAANKEFDRIRQELSKVWGIGEYSLRHIFMLLGNYENIPVDAEILKYISTHYFNGSDITAKQASQPFDKYDKFAYLVYKYERITHKLNYINK
jgi:3-methyladenine DNA glycosylase/8-oxoguanine DNA glycosylase